MPQVGLATLLIGVTLAYVALPLHRLSRASIFFAIYFTSFGLFGLFVQLLGDVPPGTPPARPLFFYALTSLALVLTGLAIVQQPGGRRFILGVLCKLLIVEIVIVGLQFSHMSFGIGLAVSEGALSDGHLIEGSYGNPNNGAVVLAMLLMLLVMTGYVRISSLSGTALVVAGVVATFLTLSRTAFALLVAFLLAAMLAPMLRRASIAASMRAARRLLLVLVVLGAMLLMLQRWGVISSLEDLAVVEHSLVRVATLPEFGQDASVKWRMVVMSRLIESLNSLGFGSLSDRNYGEFFQPLDPLLATINPHSYLVEMSFLFGYPGLFMALTFLAVAVWRIISVRGSRRFLVVVFGISVLFFQMVPSSLFSVDMFFLIVAIAGTRSLQSAQWPVSLRVSVPPLAESQVRLP